MACYDANGNIIAWTDATGRVLQRQDYDPFGNRVIRERLSITHEQSDRLEYGFSTKPLDAETGLIYYIHRYYGPRHGRWLSEDPIGVLGGLNLYGFVGNSALGKWDYLGLSERSWYQYADDCGKELFHDAARRDSICEGIALFVVWKFASLPNMIHGHAEYTGQQAGFAASTAQASGNGPTLAGLESAVANLTGAQQLAEAVNGEIPIYTDLNEARSLTFDNSNDRILHGGMGGLSVVLYGFQINRCFRPLRNQCPCPRQWLAARGGGSLVHMSSKADDILSTGRLGLPSNNYAGPASNANLSGWALTRRTGLSPSGSYGAVPIPAASEAAFSKVIPIGPFSAWQRATGQLYTARGILDLKTGAFTRTGVNWNQVGIYGFDATVTGSIIGGAYLWSQDE